MPGTFHGLNNAHDIKTSTTRSRNRCPLYDLNAERISFAARVASHIREASRFMTVKIDTALVHEIFIQRGP